MSVSTKNFEVSDYLAVAPQCGLPSNNFVPQSLWDTCATVAQRNVPAKAPKGFVTLATACLIARGMIYWKSNPGDCGTASRVDLSNSQITGEVGGAISGIASMAGASLPGIGVAVQAIESIFAHHAQAVAKEQQTICSVLRVMNQVFRYYDQQVRSGEISPSTAYAGMQTYISQVTERLQTIYKVCNSACVWIGVLQAHSDFVEVYYPAIAPMQASAHAPGGAPSAYGTTPGGVIQVGGATIAQFVNDAVNFSLSPQELIVGLIVLIAIVFGIWGLTK